MFFSSFLNNSFVPRLILMAQALEKVNVSKTEKMFFLQKMVKLFQNSVFGKIPFSQKSLTHRERGKATVLQQVLEQKPQ